MHSNKHKNKVTFEVSQRIKVLKGELPVVPQILNGRVMTVPKQKDIRGSEIIAEGITHVMGQKVDPKGRYIRKYREQLNMNHEVGLTEAWRNGGEAGLQQYISDVNMIHAIMTAPKEEKKPEEKPVTEAESALVSEVTKEEEQ